jgi:hypothetical protein
VCWSPYRGLPYLGRWEAQAFLFHVHNGPGQFETQQYFECEPSTGREHLVRVEPRYVAGARTLFKPHQDFPNTQYSLDQNLTILENGLITRNGAFYYYSVMWGALEGAFKYLNLIPGFAIPRDESLGARRGLLIAALETTIHLYKLSNQSRIVGGKVEAVAIGERGYVN